MLYNVVLVSTVQQSESAICIHIPPYPLPLDPPSRPPYPIPLGRTKHQADLPVLCSSFPLAIYFTVGSVYMSVLLSHFIPASPSPRALKSILYVCVFIHALPLGSSVPLFKIPYICVSIRYLFFSFWLTSLCMTDSMSIHLTTNNSISCLFMAQ